MAKDWTSLLQAATGYLRGKIADNETLIGEELNNDIIQFFVKLLGEAGIVPNGNFDNETNGYQLIEALVSKIRATEASITQRGAIKVATVTEVQQGSTNESAVNPSRLKDAIKLYSLYQASEVDRGCVELATQLETDEGIDDEKVITPEKLAGFNSRLKTKIIDIGDWDLSASSSVSVSHGLNDFKNIRSISIIIRNDSDNAYFSENKGAGGAMYAILGVFSINTNDIILTHDISSSAALNTNDFSSTSYNRGWVTIQYLI